MYCDVISPRYREILVPMSEKVHLSNVRGEPVYDNIYYVPDEYRRLKYTDRDL